jgi:signal transduction histidine kinase
MTLRWKTLIYISLVLAILILVLYGVALLTLRRSYLDLEEDAVAQNVQRTLNTIADELGRLESTNKDWAHWDDTYAFVQGQNSNYIEDNLAPATLVNLQVNMMLFYDVSGRLVYGAYVDLLSGESESLPRSIVHYITPESPILAHADPESVISGAMQVPEGLILFSSRPVLMSDFQGPIQGTLVLGYFMDENRIQIWSDALRLNIQAYPFSAAQLPRSVADAKSSLADTEGIIVQPINGDVISGYGVLKDIEGDPAMILRVDVPRDIYKQGMRTLYFFLVSLLIVGVAASVIMLWLIERVVLSRLAAVSLGVARVRATGDLSVSIEVSEQDELTELAAGINGMLGELAQSREQLQKTNVELEARVAERTAALSETNIRLQEEIAERRQAQLDLAQARDQAMEALRLKSQILANVSHDARTPLNVITLMVEALQSDRYGELNPRQQKAVERIRLSTQEMLGFINNMLEGARLDSNHQVKLVDQVFRPSELLSEVVLLMKPLADRKGLHLESSVDEAVPLTLYGDFDRLKQILQNLVNNAIKFTRAGTITARIYCPGEGQWALETSDTGIGIAEEVQERIFDPFWQVDGSMTREADRGVGLGLSIVKQLAVLMGDQVKLVSIVGQGSTFTVLLPIKEPD